MNRGRIEWRKVWLQIHLWLGLTVGIIGALLGITGSLLVYDHELDAWLNRQRYAISGAQPALPFAEYAVRATQALGGSARSPASPASRC